MRLSIVTAVLNSHEIVRRQLRHYEKILAPYDNHVEVVMVDDGSDPPLQFDTRLEHFTGVATGNKTPWSEHAARNMGASIAKGKYLFMIDIDYVIPAETIPQVLQFDGDRMDIERWFGVLNEHIEIARDPATLEDYGLLPGWIRHKKPIPGHRSQFVIRRELFWKLGGYREDLAGVNHPNGGGAGQKFHGKWRLWKRNKETTVASEKALVYMFPVGKFCLDNNNNPLGLFHDLERL